MSKHTNFNMIKPKVAIIGGGASGLMASIALAKNLTKADLNKTEIVILERMDRVGKKLLATGNGRCNLTNLNEGVTNYHSLNLKSLNKVLPSFTPKDTISFFESIGLLCRIESDGKVYPYSNQATSVLDVLRLELSYLNIKEICQFEVKTITKHNNEFIITDRSNNVVKASKVIVSTGGKSQQNLGSNGSGYELLKNLGHKVTPVFPSLVQLKTDNKLVKSLNGIKLNCEAAISVNNNKLRTEAGELLFTEYGFSGIMIFQLSRIFGEYNIKNNNIFITIDTMPEFNKAKLINLIKSRIKSNEEKTLEELFIGILNKRVAQAILKSSNLIPLSRCVNSLTLNEIKNLVETMKRWQFRIVDSMSWNNSQVTAGGINLAEVDLNTFESRLVKNLYITGELLDVDGDCGGFNLQWAWASGFIAGKSASY